MKIIIAVGVFLFWYNAIDHTTIEGIKTTTNMIMNLTEDGGLEKQEPAKKTKAKEEAE